MSYIKEPKIANHIIREALREDIGRHDITSDLIIPKNKSVRAVILARKPFVVCGLFVTAKAFRLLDKNIKFITKVPDSQVVRRGEVIAEIRGNAQAILAAERVALNFLAHLSAISTQTRKFTRAIKPFKTKILDTRKTTPGLRMLEKYAIRMGGGYNHRMSLDEMILVKDNHLQILGGFKNLAKLSTGYEVELEVSNLQEFRKALALKPDIIMLDNMDIQSMRKAVRIRNSLSGRKHPKLEASGGITLKNVKSVAGCGVDFISVGSLTHSVNSVDISLEIL